MGKLVETHEIVVEGVQGELVGDDLLQELAKALEEGNHSICLCHCIVWLIGFWDDDDFHCGPGMMTQFDGFAQNGCEVGRMGLKAPFEELVGNAGGPRRRSVRGGLEGGSDLVGCNGDEVP